MSDLVGNPKDWFSRVAAHITVVKHDTNTSTVFWYITVHCLPAIVVNPAPGDCIAIPSEDSAIVPRLSRSFIVFCEVTVRIPISPGPAIYSINTAHSTMVMAVKCTIEQSLILADRYCKLNQNISLRKLVHAIYRDFFFICKRMKIFSRQSLKCLFLLHTLIVGTL